MSRLRVESVSLSVDGFGAGPDQSLQQPMGRGGMALHEWALATRTFHQRALGSDGGATEGVDERFAARGFEGLGAWILGRNMFGPVRGPWPDESWQGWWGDEPPYHVPVFVLTHHPRPPLAMQGGTTFHFVTEGLSVALQRARAAAGALDVRLGGGMASIRQALQARLVDRMHLALAPVLLGQGEPLLTGLDLPALGYRCAGVEAGERATHVVIERA
ncbi:MAG: dihydrofolate reductase family protein [Proteobacteria bacterium]|nr:dihydrofolate reductase family protein [Pseudomonadota bacterium]